MIFSKSPRAAAVSTKLLPLNGREVNDIGPISEETIHRLVCGKSSSFGSSGEAGAAGTPAALAAWLQRPPNPNVPEGPGTPLAPPRAGGDFVSTGTKGVDSEFMLRLYGRGQIMPDRSDEFRRKALDCLRLARQASDEIARTSLLMMAQRWFDLANGPASQEAFDAAVREFNEGQMTPKPAMQQQQQVQPKDEDKNKKQ